MIIVDTALMARAQQGKPIRVGMAGASFMGQGLTNQITYSVPGTRMAAVYNRHSERAQHVYRYSGLDNSVMAGSQAQLDYAYGMYATYVEAANADEMSGMRLLPEGLVVGCRLKRPIPKDQALTYNGLELPKGRIADTLRAEQYRHFRRESWLEEHLAGTHGVVGAGAVTYA
jgi:predicted homoserine dehydrogenase-like protein